MVPAETNRGYTVVPEEKEKKEEKAKVGPHLT
jgi:hypothetical protein